MTEREIFIIALQMEDSAQRQAYLEEACAGHLELRKQVEHLLQLYEGAGSFLEKPAADSPATGPTRVAKQTAPHESPGAVIGPYKLLEQIGEGGMGSVWMAQQAEPVRRLVAVKLIRIGMDSKQVIARFEAERQALALMDHTNIARVLEAGTTEAGPGGVGPGRPYFVMDLVKGVPITKYCDDHRLTPRQRLELFIPICQAVQHAHQKGIIHRDLKPSNVLVALYDGRPVPKIIDFGVAKATGQTLTDKTLVTSFGAIVGTLEYMSPEQAEINQLDIDTRSDIYSLGVLLYELLAGSPPFSRRELEKAGMLEMLRVIREQEPSKPSTKLSTAEGLPTLAANRGTEPAKLTKLVRGELDWIVMKALEKDRNRRYETANGFAMDLQRYLNDEPVQACPPSAGYRLRKFARKHKKGLATVAAFAVLLIAATASSIVLASWAVRERVHAEAQRRAAEANFKRALDAVDHMLTRVGEDRLTNVPQMEPVRRELLQDALRFYQEFLGERGDSPAVRSEAGRAYRRVGQIQVLLGDRDEGEASYQQAVVLFEQLLPESPGDPTLLNELGEIHNALGLLYFTIQEWSKAEAAFEKGVAILDEQVPGHQIPLENRQTLAKIHNSLLIFYRQTGHLDQAETAFLKCKELVGAPDEIASLTLLARAHINAGLVYGAKGKTDAAEAVYLKGLELCRKLVQDAPEEVAPRKLLARTHNNLGLLYSQTGQPDKVEEHYRECIAMHQAVLDEHPKVVEYQADLAGSYSNMATHVRRTRSAEESLEWIAKAMHAAQPILAQDSRFLPARLLLFDTLMGRAYALVELERLEEAAEDWRQILEISEGQSHINLRLYRPFALVFLGQHAQATAEIETLVAEGHTQGRNPLLFAKVQSLCSAAAAADSQLPAAERDQLAGQYASRAIELLRNAQTAGLFEDPRQLAQLRESKDLETIRMRPDFQRLLAVLELKASDEKQ